MGELEEKYIEIQDRITKLSTIDGSEDLIEDIELFGEEDEDIFNLFFDFYKRLQILINEKLIFEKEVMESKLISNLQLICFGEKPTIPLPSYYYKYRKLFRDILYGFSFEFRQKIIQQVIKEVVDHPLTKERLWLVSTVGFNNDELSKTLRNYFQVNDNELGDIAFSTYISLGNTHNQSKLVNLLHSRIEKKFSRWLIYPAARVGTGETAKILIDAWMKTGLVNFGDMEILRVLSGIDAICQKLWRKEEEINEIWKQLWTLLDDIEYRKVIAFSQSPRKINTTQVIPNLIEEMLFPRSNVKKENIGPGIALTNSVLESALPNHVKSWGNLSNNTSIKRLLPALLRNSGADGFYTTSEGEIKERILQIFLNAGNLSFYSSIEEIVEEEESKFIQAEILNELSCFELEPPKFIINWVQKNRDIESSDGRPISQFEAALRFLAFSNPSFETLKTIMEFGLTYKGNVLLTTLEIITTLSIWLAKKDVRTLVEYFFAELFSRDDYNHQFILSSIILTLSVEYKSVVKEFERKLFKGINSISLCSTAKGDLLETLGIINNLPNYELLSKINTWAMDEAAELSDKGVFYLLRVGKYRDDLLSQRLGFEKNSKGIWEISWESDTPKPEFWGTWVGLLFRNDPEKFSNVVEQIICYGRWDENYQLINTISGNRKIPVNGITKSFIDALKFRIKTFAESSRFESSTLNLFFKVSPSEFARYDWNTEVINWIEDGREFIAKKLSAIPTELFNEFEVSISGCLQMLINDEQYAVRRSAFHSLSILSQRRLVNLCELYSKNENYEYRRIAAEGFIWIEEEKRRRALNEDLAKDKVRFVRDATDFSLEQQRLQICANQYLEKLVTTKYLGNEQVLDMWRYANALVKVGDDYSILKLEQFLKNEEQFLSLNVSWFFLKTIKSLKQEWKRKTQKWPEPWIVLQGDIEKCKGYATISNKKEKFTAYFWKRKRTLSHDVSAWGGYIIFENISYLIGIEELEIILNDGSKGKILFNSIHNNMAYFVGYGPFIRQKFN